MDRAEFLNRLEAQLLDVPQAEYFSAGRPDIPPLSLPRETASWQQAQRRWPAIQTTGGFCIFRILSPRRNRGCRI